jgi:hypothetical protein
LPVDFSSGSLNYQDENADADLLISFSGPTGQGKLHVVGSKRAGKWHYSELQFIAARTGETVDLSEDLDK